MPAITAIVLHHNGTKLIGACLQTLLAQNQPGVEACVVDNASTDGSPAWLRTRYPGVRLIETGGNRGWSGGNNVGIRQALRTGADWIWLLNDDIELEPDCLRNLLAFAAAHPTMRLLSPVISWADDRSRIWFQGGAVDSERMTISHCPDLQTFHAISAPIRKFLSGCCLLVHRTVFEQIGLPDERFFMYCEDADFSLRAADAGFGLGVVENARIAHHLMASTGGAHATSPFRTYHTLRSELFFWRKHLGFRAFHQRYCPAHLQKWFADGQTDDDEKRKLQDAKCDALWFFLTPWRSHRPWPTSPAWFRRTMRRRPWVVIAMLSWHWRSLFGRPPPPR